MKKAKLIAFFNERNIPFTEKENALWVPYRFAERLIFVKDKDHSKLFRGEKVRYCNMCLDWIHYIVFWVKGDNEGFDVLYELKPVDAPSNEIFDRFPFWR